MKKILAAFILILINTGFLSAQLDKESLYMNIVERFKNAESISLDFTLRENPEFTGHFRAVRGNKYIMEIGARQLISNGKTIWNYDRAEKTVVVSELLPDENDFSIEKFFFEILESYKPVKLTKESSSAGNSLLKLEIVPKNNSGRIADINRIFIWLNSNSKEIRSIGIFTPEGSQVWDIGDVETNVGLEQEDFTFDPPENVEVIDLR